MQLRSKILDIRNIYWNKYDNTKFSEDLHIQEIQLKKMIGTLLDLDCHISALKDALQEDFNEFYPTNTPREIKTLNKTIVAKYNKLKDGLLVLFDAIPYLNTSIVLKCIEKYILLANTRNIQYIIFEYLKRDPLMIIDFFISKLEDKKYFSYTLTFLVGLTIRFKLPENLKEKCTLAILAQFSKYNLDLNQSFDNQKVFLHLCQSLIYLACFDSSFYKQNIEIFQLFIKYNVVNKINPNVSAVFLDKYYPEYELNSLYEYKEIFEFFPFDLPCVYEVKERFEDCYVHFKS